MASGGSRHTNEQRKVGKSQESNARKSGQRTGDFLESSRKQSQFSSHTHHKYTHLQSARIWEIGTQDTFTLPFVSLQYFYLCLRTWTQLEVTPGFSSKLVSENQQYVNIFDTSNEISCTCTTNTWNRKYYKLFPEICLLQNNLCMSMSVGWDIYIYFYFYKNMLLC